MNLTEIQQKIVQYCIDSNIEKIERNKVKEQLPDELYSQFAKYQFDGISYVNFDIAYRMRSL